MGTGCNSCEYLSKRAGVGNYFVYKCSYWGLVTEKILPQSVVISSLGKPCPFYKEKVKKTKINNDSNKKDNGGDNILDIII
ncbi:MAG TPA: hypothetical protein PK771_02405 [Spirochaetota bacterium]|nr:hypothetical protein [Spirochaetota bacterium]